MLGTHVGREQRSLVNNGTRRNRVGRLLAMTGLAATVLVAPVGAITGVAQAAARGELVVNGTFDSGTTAPWWKSATTTYAVTSGQLRATVPTGTVNSYDATVGQSAIALTAGKRYTMVFDASATATVTIRVTVQLEASPYTATLDQQATFDGTLKRYTLPFTSTLTTTTAQVNFQLGGKGAFTAALDNISLTPSPLDLTTGFYVDPGSNSKVWLGNNPTDSRAVAIEANIASKAGAKWFGNWNDDVNNNGTTGDTSDDYLADVRTYVSAADTAGKLPILAAYNITDRDCGGESTGGAGGVTEYQLWAEQFARAIDNRPAVVIIEPDAVAQSTLDECMTGTERQTRLDLLRYATEKFRDLAPNTWAYLDAGNSGWRPASVVAPALELAGLRNVRGFAVNVSNFYTTAESTTYASAVQTLLTFASRYMVDTSRNGNGAPPADVENRWCNPAGRKLGVTSQVGTGGPELLLWVKVPGDSDGSCGIGAGIPAGTFGPDLAIRLINGS
jgi:endoglucanase